MVETKGGRRLSRHIEMMIYDCPATKTYKLSDPCAPLFF